MQLARMVNRFGAGHVDGIQRIGHGLQVPSREVQIDHRVPEFDVPEQQLNGAQVGSRLQQVSGKAVTAIPQAE